MTAVEWLADKYNLVTWLRNRDEISPEAADEMRRGYLYQAKEMDKEQTIEFAKNCLNKALDLDIRTAYSNVEQYYNETYGKQ